VLSQRGAARARAGRGGRRRGRLRCAGNRARCERAASPPRREAARRLDVRDGGHGDEADEGLERDGRERVGQRLVRTADAYVIPWSPTRCWRGSKNFAKSGRDQRFFSRSGPTAGETRLLKFWRATRCPRPPRRASQLACAPQNCLHDRLVAGPSLFPTSCPATASPLPRSDGCARSREAPV
jgi:hypothetical protein